MWRQSRVLAAVVALVLVAALFSGAFALLILSASYSLVLLLHRLDAGGSAAAPA
jgi:hypothetical protein